MPARKNLISINITTLTILKIVLILLGVYFLYLIWDILVIIFVSLLIASAVRPWVDWMHQRRIPRFIGMVLIYLVLFTVIIGLLGLIIPPITSQVNELSKNLPQILEKVVSSVAILEEYAIEHSFFNQFKSGFGSWDSGNWSGAVGGIFSAVSSIFGSIVSLFLILVITFYMGVEENATRKMVWSLVPAQYQAYTISLLNQMQRKVGLWLRGQLILSLIIFVLTYLGLLILGVKYALILALIAGITEFIPYLGPIIAAIPAVFLAFTQSPLLALFVAILYYVIQLAENNVIVPKLMQKVIGLNPIVSIIVLLIGFRVAGVIGAILALPAATAAGVLLKELFNRKLKMDQDSSEAGKI